VDFFDLKGWLEALLEQFQTGELFFSATDQEPFLHPGRTGYIMAGGKRLGFLGELNPATVAAWELKGRAVVGELDLDALALMGTRNITYKDISRFPATCRDAAFIIPREETADKLLKAIRETPQVLLEKVEVFDLYTGPGLAPQTKSLGLRFAYRSGERTLTDIEVNEIHQKLIDRIKEKTGATLRGAAN
jgi:phenylalanyl-tRNA synthetase beta chain